MIQTDLELEIRQEADACREACKHCKVGDVMQHIHHEQWLEILTEPIENRIAFILVNKTPPEGGRGLEEGGRGLGEGGRGLEEGVRGLGEGGRGLGEGGSLPPDACPSCPGVWLPLG